MTGTTTFEPVEKTLTGVGEHAADFLHRKLAKVNKRLAKLNAPPATLTFGPLVERTERDEFTGLKRTWREFETVTVTGVEAKFAGWRGVASFDLTLVDGEAFVTKFPGAEDVAFPDEFRFRGPLCDHCNKVRSRNKTVLFLHDDGRWMNVGTSCCVDFIGVDPATVLWLAAPAFGFDDDDDLDGGFRGAPRETPPLEFLTAAALATEVLGFVKSRPDSYFDVPTKDRAWMLLNGRRNEVEAVFGSAVRDGVDKARATAEAVAAWVEADDGYSDYMYNAKLALKAWKVTNKTDGLLASLPFSYMRHLGKLAERKAERAARPTDFLGTVGEKLTVEGVVTFKMAFEPYAWNGPTPYRVNVLTDDGYTVTTKGSGMTLGDCEVGDRVTMTGKVKALDDHEKFGKRTVLERVKLAVLEEAPPTLEEVVAAAASPVEEPTAPTWDPGLEVAYNAALEVSETKGLLYSAKTATLLVDWVWANTGGTPDDRLDAARALSRA